MLSYYTALVIRRTTVLWNYPPSSPSFARLTLQLFLLVQHKNSFPLQVKDCSFPHSMQSIWQCTYFTLKRVRVKGLAKESRFLCTSPSCCRLLMRAREGKLGHFACSDSALTSSSTVLLLQKDLKLPRDNFPGNKACACCDQCNNYCTY